MIRSIWLLVAWILLAPLASAADWPAATVYKSPQCGCCTEYVSYLQSHGVQVESVSTDDLLGLNRRVGVPEHYAGCHTTLIGGYVVSGHVPIDIVERLLRERPAVTGITLPGMPQGSPGMSGQKREPFHIYQFSAGSQSVESFSVD